MANVRTAELGRAIKRRRTDLGLSLRDVGELTGVSSSTLNRIENGIGHPDSRVVSAVANWLESPIETFFDVNDKKARVAYFETEPTPEKLARILENDRNLSSAQAEALAEMFRHAYKAATQG